VRLFFLLIIAAASTFSCHSEKRSALTEHAWHIRQMKYYNYSQWTLLPGFYRLSFSKHNQASLRLDANTCYGEVRMGRKFIDLNLNACSSRCCDSSFVIDLKFMLNHVNQYTLNGDTLILYGLDSILAFPTL
jgi:hypothetical protein